MYLRDANPMLRTILIGLDGSPACAATVKLGLRWAKQFDAMLVGVGVVNEPAIRGAVSHPREGGYLSHLQEQWLAESRKRLDHQLEAFALECASAQVACKLLEDTGAPWEEIVREAQRYDVVMLSQQSHFEGESPRHTLHEVLWSSARPVVVAPAELPESRGGEVIVAYDGSVQSARALQMFVGSGLQALGPVRVVSVCHQERVEAARIADRAVQYLTLHEIAATAEAIDTAESACDVLCEIIRERSAELLVMGACGTSRVVEFFFGSTTNTMIETCTVPAFMYH
jgi:nucleotide-binding universal stress UspA family protein